MNAVMRSSLERTDFVRRIYGPRVGARGSSEQCSSWQMMGDGSQQRCTATDSARS